MPPTSMPTITYERLEPTLRTGDIFLFHGVSAISKLIERQTRSQFSHAAMVIRPHRSRRPYLWETGPVKIVKDVWTHTDHGGAQLGDLATALWFCAQPKYGDMPYWRRLNFKRSKLFEEMAMAIVVDIEGRPFPTIRQGKYQAAMGRKHRVESDRTLFCAELVAETMMRLGLLSFDPPPNGYQPASFSKQNTRLPLLKGATLGPEFKVIPPPRP